MTDRLDRLDGGDADRAWVATSEELAYDGFFRIVQRGYVLPGGVRATWDLLDLPPTVSVLALTPEGRCVMVRQFRPGPDRVVMSLAGGLVDPGESVADAAARELREETGYVAGSVEVIASVDHNSRTHPVHSVIARDCVLTTEQDLDELEQIEVVVVDVEEVRAQLRAGLLGASEQTYLALDHAGQL